MKENVEKTTSNENLLNLKKTVEQLKLEANLNRQKASVGINDLIAYCEKHKKQDVLANGFRFQQHNPFRDTADCIFF